MPELPEVHSVMLGLNQLVKGKQIDRVEIAWPRIVGAENEQEAQAFAQKLQGETIGEVSRRGKYLIFKLRHWDLISHLRMEGKYHYFPRIDKETLEIDKHCHVFFYFTDQSLLIYHDVRKFGRMELVPKEELDAFFLTKQLGPEPSEETFHGEDFYQALQSSHRPIKTLLLDQKLVAGLGNIYVDESLFRAGVLPNRPANSLTHRESLDLRQAILDVIQAATLAGGSSVRTYRNSLGQAGQFQQSLKVYGRKGQACLECGQVIEKIQLNQRGTHFCPHCQK